MSRHVNIRLIVSQLGKEFITSQPDIASSDIHVQWYRYFIYNITMRKLYSQLNIFTLWSLLVNHGVACGCL